MKMKRIALVGVLALTAFALFACGGSKEINEEAKTAFVGVWEWVEDIGDTETDSYSREEVAELKELGLTSKIVICEDGTFAYDEIGTVETGTWFAKDGINIKLEFETEYLTANLENGVLKAFFDGGDSFYELNGETAVATAADYVTPMDPALTEE